MAVTLEKDERSVPGSEAKAPLDPRFSALVQLLAAVRLRVVQGIESPEPPGT